MNMSFNKSTLHFFLLSVLLFWLNACDAKKLDDSEKQTVQPTVKIVVTPTIPILVPMPTATTQVIHPIIGGTLITTDQENRLVEALQLEDCELPCYLGIAPGNTSWVSARQILASLGAEYEGEDYESGTGMRGYAYKILVNDTTLVTRTPIANPTHPLNIVQSLSFLIGSDSIVQRISVNVGTAVQELKFHNYWSRYSPQQIFIRLGIPNEIYYSARGGNEMAIVYKSLGVVLKFIGIKEGNATCPNFEIKGYTEREFILTNMASDLSLLPQSERVPFTDREYWLPVNEILGLSREDFYNQVVANPSVCF